MPAGLHAKACVHDEPQARRGLRDSRHAERLCREYHRDGLPVVERGLQRPLQPRYGHGQLSERDVGLQLVGLQWDAEALQRLFRGRLPHLCSRRLLRHRRTERQALRIEPVGPHAHDRGLRLAQLAAAAVTKSGSRVAVS
jgi:hypothetical protein